MKTAILFGGSGYIARFLLKHLINSDSFENYIVLDIKPLDDFDSEIKSGKIKYFFTDVREPIPEINTDFNKKESWIFNFAAIHREPGHEYQEYFDTNIPGAININAFAEKTGINNILFTSSIAPYGLSVNQRNEKSPLYPKTAYGISKALAEKIHEKWLTADKARRLIIVRPSVIYGPNDPGNVYRMIKALKKGRFILPNGGNVIKAYGYIYGLIDSIIFVMDKKDKFILYNYAENPIENLKEMTKIVKAKFNYNKPTLSISVKLLSIIAFYLQLISKITGKKSDIHPVRVKKASFPTNIKPQYLIDSKFQFKYNFDKSLDHWKKNCPSEF